MDDPHFKDFPFPKLKTIHTWACAYAICRMVGTKM